MKTEYNSNKMDEMYSLREASRLNGVPTQALRRYCNEGTIRHVKRKRSGYRVLDAEQVTWARKLWYLERCGFNRADRKMYARLTWRGAETRLERKAMLETKKRNLWQKIEECQEDIDFIEREVELFDQESTAEVGES